MFKLNLNFDKPGRTSVKGDIYLNDGTVWVKILNEDELMLFMEKAEANNIEFYNVIKDKNKTYIQLT